MQANPIRTTASEYSTEKEHCITRKVKVGCVYGTRHESQPSHRLRGSTGLYKRNLPRLCALVDIFWRSANQPQAKQKTQPPNLHKTWEGFFSEALYICDGNMCLHGHFHSHSDIREYGENNIGSEEWYRPYAAPSLILR